MWRIKDGWKEITCEMHPRVLRGLGHGHSTPLIYNSETTALFVTLVCPLVWIKIEIFMDFGARGEGIRVGLIQGSEHALKVDWSLSHCHHITFSSSVIKIKIFGFWCVCVWVCRGIWVKAHGNLVIGTFRHVWLALNHDIGVSNYAIIKNPLKYVNEHKTFLFVLFRLWHVLAMHPCCC